jgi:hypothetical protein
MDRFWLPEAAFAADERAVARALRDYDDELRLVPQPTENGLAYQVRRYRGGDKPSEFLFFWVDERGEPLPLSMNILDLVKQHDRNTQSAYLDEVARDELKRQRDDAHWEAQTQAMADDWVPRHGRPVLPRSVSLRQSRDKQRAKGKKV